jgi:hypothetical protein
VRRRLRPGRDARRLGWIALSLLVGVPRLATARERLAVIVVVEGNPALADNLTEIAIAALAERRDRELVGLREIRDSLAGILPVDGLVACLGRPDCLAHVVAAAGATEAVIADIRMDPHRYIVRLSLIDTRAQDNGANVSMTVPQDQTSLISAVRRGVSNLLEQREAEARTAAFRAALSVRQSHSEPTAGSAQPVLLDLEPHRTPQSTRGRGVARWEPYVGFGAAALAVVSLSAAVVAGSLATPTPVGSTRAEAQADLTRRDNYATAANALFGVGGVFSVAAGTSFVLWWRAERDRTPSAGP